MPVKYPKSDSRLIGTWISDAEKTTGNWVYPKRLATQKRKAFEGIFGVLKLQFTRGFLTCRYDDSVWRSRYEIVAVDKRSVVIRIESGELDGDDYLEQLIFDEDGYMLKFCAGTNIEYFRKLSS